MADFVNTIDVLGDEATAASIISGTITELKDDVIVTIKTDQFYQQNNLTVVDFPNVSKLGNNAFYDCSKLESANLPNADSLEKYIASGSVFAKCMKLSSVNIRNFTNLGQNFFYGCKQLAFIDLPKVVNIGNQCFAFCNILSVIILRSETVCTLASANALVLTPFAAGKAGGTVYVPSALITEYQNATNWSTLYAAGTCNFVAIEGSEYE